MLFFVHIPKTAGTSLRAQVARMCKPGGFVEAYGNELCAAQPNGDFIAMLKRRAADIQVVFGHYGWGARELLGEPSATYATMLRDPLTRAASFYAHVAREPRSRHFKPIQQGMGLQELVLSHKAPELNNHFVRMILGSARWRLSLWPPDPTAEACRIDQLFERRHLEEAWDRLTADFCHVGRAERYRDSLAALARILGATPIEQEEHLNVRPPDAAPLRIDAETESVLRQYNALDIELYQRVVQRWG